MDAPWILHGVSMDNLWILWTFRGRGWVWTFRGRGWVHGYSMDTPWSIHELSMDYQWTIN
jgi:hypothetical protein